MGSGLYAGPAGSLIRETARRRDHLLPSVRFSDRSGPLSLALRLPGAAPAAETQAQQTCAKQCQAAGLRRLNLQFEHFACERWSGGTVADQSSGGSARRAYDVATGRHTDAVDIIIITPSVDGGGGIAITVVRTGAIDQFDPISPGADRRIRG